MPRHQTLRAAIDWSFELLTEEEAALLRRLSVFAGGLGLGAAEAVGVGDPVDPYDVLDLIARLADKSLVTVELLGSGGPLPPLGDPPRVQLRAARPGRARRPTRDVAIVTGSWS